MPDYSFAELYSRLGTDEKRLCQAIEDLAQQHGDQVFHDLFVYLFNKYFQPDAAARYWQETMSLYPPQLSHLNHRAALLNYLLHHTDELIDPRVIEAQTLENLQRSAFCDGLTGLYNQSYFKSQLEKTLSHCRNTAGATFSLLLFDLDNFKQFNDRCGHLCGDRALARVAGLMLDALPEDAHAARYGGEEFAVLLPQTNLAQAIVVAERIRRAIDQATFAGEERLDRGKLTISGGVANYPSTGTTSAALIAHADSKLYEAKATRNRIAPSAVDSRGIIRHSFRSIVEVLDQRSGEYTASLSSDISYTGLLLKSAQASQVGEQLQLRFAFPFWPSDHLTDGLVRHVRTADSRGDFLIGIEFTQPEVEFIEKILPAELSPQLAAS